jgi:hypothetical protein
MSIITYLIYKVSEKTRTQEYETIALFIRENQALEKELALYQKAWNGLHFHSNIFIGLRSAWFPSRASCHVIITINPLVWKRNARKEKRKSGTKPGGFSDWPLRAATDRSFNRERTLNPSTCHDIDSEIRIGTTKTPELLVSVLTCHSSQPRGLGLITRLVPLRLPGGPELGPTTSA